LWQCDQIGQNLVTIQHCSYIYDSVTRLGEIWLWHSAEVIFVTVKPVWAQFGYDTALQLYFVAEMKGCTGIVMVWQCDQIGQNLAMAQDCSYILRLKWKGALAQWWCDSVTRLGKILLMHSTAVIFWCWNERMHWHSHGVTVWPDWAKFWPLSYFYFTFLPK